MSTWPTVSCVSFVFRTPTKIARRSGSVLPTDFQRRFQFIRKISAGHFVDRLFSRQHYSFLTREVEF